MTKSTGKRFVSKRGSSPEERLKSHMIQDGKCWIWVGAVDRRGYGKLNVNKKYVQTHRLSWELFRGPIGKYQVCHKCDNPSCINPEHLFLGTQKENLQDMKIKNRSRRGEKHPRAKLNENLVREIMSSRESATSLGKRLGVSQAAVSHIRSGKNRAHIK